MEINITIKAPDSKYDRDFIVFDRAENANDRGQALLTQMKNDFPARNYNSFTTTLNPNRTFILKNT